MITQIMPADSWYGRFQTRNGIIYVPLVAWGLLKCKTDDEPDSEVVGLVALDNRGSVGDVFDYAEDLDDRDDRDRHSDRTFFINYSRDVIPTLLHNQQ